MACPAIITGDRFLGRTLDHLDCQAQLLGSYGYSALGEPGSLASVVVTGLLTLFIALYALRLLLGSGVGGRDVVVDTLKVGIVLALAFSWPAFRTVIYDVVLQGPAQVVDTIGSSGLGTAGTGFTDRLEAVDASLVQLSIIGTGRESGAVLGSNAPGSTFAGSMLQEDAAYGYARLLYLAGTIGSLGLLRLLAGILLAIAPLIAGLLLFEATRGLFAGWLRGLALAALGSIGLTLVLAVELSILEPWIADAFRVRAAGYATPSVPIEGFAIALAFVMVKFGIIWLLAKVAFGRGWLSIPAAVAPAVDLWRTRSAAETGPVPALISRSRAERTSDSVERLVSQERYFESQRNAQRLGQADAARGGTSTSDAGTGTLQVAPRLGSSWRRAVPRPSMAGNLRDSRR